MSAGYLEVRNRPAIGMAMTGSRGEGPPMSQRKRTFGKQLISVDKD
jgi:hypothetical protein